MFKPKTLIVLLAFLLINFLALFLCAHTQENNVQLLLIWSNTHIVYLFSVSNILTKHLTSGVIEQIIIISGGVKKVVTEIILIFWLKVGISLAILSTITYWCVSTDDIALTKLLLFFISISYSTIALTPIGSMCNILSISNAPITTMVLSIPISIPVIVTAALMISDPSPHFSLLASMLICNTLIAIGSLFLTTTVVAQATENR